MAIKGFGIALKLTLAGSNQLTHPSTYVFGIVVVVSILVQMNYFNKALAIFSTNVVNPMYYVTFSTAVIVASTILFQGFNTTNTTNTLSLLAGFIVTFLGVHLLNISREPEAPPLSPENSRHVHLETGLMYPRLSLSGRASHDGWPLSAGLHNSHSRRGSVNSLSEQDLPRRHYAGVGPADDAIRLERLREEDEDDDVDETTRLRRPDVHWDPPRDGGARGTSPPSSRTLAATGA